MGENARIREEEHTAFVQTKADLEQGLEGTQTAIRILREHFGPGMNGDSSGGAVGGILGMLEVVESDVSKSLVQVQEHEDAAQESLEQITHANEIAAATKEKDIEYRESTGTTLERSMSEDGTDHATASDELKAVLKYQEVIRSQCLHGPESYEQRRARREAELDGLKEALEVLNSQTALLQKHGHAAMTSRL
eukprot:NODE_3277_length_808_cov_331.581673.p1 GENE.NODE_3277_length_808_cov_331.581673~~NODE_3277_length_808_cov_331.581673.p1  ORF type:complete len:193 (+),score=83.04 NODE_3277_length_808_cov_331.581673:3-581(+)